MFDEQDEVGAAVAAKSSGLESLLLHTNVVGAAVGYRQREGEFTDEVCVQVFVSQKVPLDSLAHDQVVPRELPGPAGKMIPTDVVETGPIEPLQDFGRYRPVVGGCSISPLAAPGSYGTLGGWVSDLGDDSVVLLTNNHVVTLPGNTDRIPSPSTLVQPVGGSATADQIGRTKRIVPIATSATASGAPTTSVDAAIATITAPRTDNVLNIGPGVYELGAVTLGLDVQKRGARTGFTRNGRVTSISTSVRINYGTVMNPRFAIIGTGNSVFAVTSTDGNRVLDRGDSGSLIFSQARGRLRTTFPVVGINFGGGAAGPNLPFGTLMFACEINAVLNALNVTTLCTGAARALIRSVVSGGRSSGDVGDEVDRKELQLRRFSDKLLSTTPLGQKVLDLVMTETPSLAGAILEDEEAFGLAVKVASPWIERSTNFDILEAELDASTTDYLGRLIDRVSAIAPEAAEELKARAGLVQQGVGLQVRALLESHLNPSSDSFFRPS